MNMKCRAIDIISRHIVPYTIVAIQDFGAWIFGNQNCTQFNFNICESVPQFQPLKDFPHEIRRRVGEIGIPQDAFFLKSQ